MAETSFSQVGVAASSRFLAWPLGGWGERGREFCGFVPLLGRGAGGSCLCGLRFLFFQDTHFGVCFATDCLFRRYVIPLSFSIRLLAFGHSMAKRAEGMAGREPFVAGHVG